MPSNIIPRALFYRNAIEVSYCWDHRGAGDVQEDPQILQLSSYFDAMGNEYPEYCIALRYQSGEPDWADSSEGIISLEPWALNILAYVDEYRQTQIGGGPPGSGWIDPLIDIRICAAGNPITSGMTAAQLGAAYGAATSYSWLARPICRGWNAWYLDPASGSPLASWQYGVIIAAYPTSAAGPGSLCEAFAAEVIGRGNVLEQAPVQQVHCAVDLDASSLSLHSSYTGDSRSDLPANISETIDSTLKSPSWRVSAFLEGANADEEEIEVTEYIRSESRTQLFRDMIDFPKTWELQASNPGAAILKHLDSLDEWEGRILRFELQVGVGLTFYSVAQRRVYVRMASRSSGQGGQLRFEGLRERIADLPLCYLCPEETWEEAYLEYDDICPVALAFMALIDAGLRPTEEMFAHDWPWLFARACSLVSNRTYTDEALGEMSVGEWLEDILQTFGLFISTANNRVLLWSPCWYRPSMRVHTVDMDAPGHGVQSYDQRFSTHQVYDLLAASWSETVGGSEVEMEIEYRPPTPRRTERLDFDDIEIEYALDSAPDLSATTGHAGVYALLAAIAQATAYHTHILTLRMDKRALQYAIGDKVVFSSERLGYDETAFAITEIAAGLNENMVEVVMRYWPLWRGAASTWQDASRLLGIWRWATRLNYEQPCYILGLNRVPWRASIGASDWTILDQARNVKGSWQGGLIKRQVAGDYDAVARLDDGASIPALHQPDDESVDTFEVQVALEGWIQELFHPVDGYGEGYFPILFWWDAGHDNEYHTLGICARAPSGESIPTPRDSFWFFGVPDITGDPAPSWPLGTSWHALATGPIGVGTPTSSSPLSDPHPRVTSLVAQWGEQTDSYAQGYIRYFSLYVNGRFAGSDIRDPLGGPPVSNRLRLRSYYDNGAGLHAGTVRQWKSASAVPQNELCGPNGVDPLYP